MRDSYSVCRLLSVPAAQCAASPVQRQIVANADFSTLGYCWRSIPCGCSPACRPPPFFLTLSTRRAWSSDSSGMGVGQGATSYSHPNSSSSCATGCAWGWWGAWGRVRWGGVGGRGTIPSAHSLSMQAASYAACCCALLRLSSHPLPDLPEFTTGRSARQPTHPTHPSTQPAYLPTGPPAEVFSLGFTLT
jgi:hypothetical protein